MLFSRLLTDPNHMERMSHSHMDQAGTYQQVFSSHGEKAVRIK